MGSTKRRGRWSRLEQMPEIPLVGCVVAAIPALVYALAFIVAVWAAVSVCFRLGSGAPRGPAPGGPLTGAANLALAFVEGPQSSVVAQLGLMAIGITYQLGGLPAAPSVPIGAVLLGLAGLLWTMPMVCRLCHLRVYTATILAACGAAFVAATMGVLVGGALLLAAMPYEARLLRDAGPATDPFAGTEMPGNERRRAVLSAMFWSALLPVLPAHYPILFLAVFLLALPMYMISESKRHLLSDRAVALIARIGDGWPYDLLARRRLAA